MHHVARMQHATCGTHHAPCTMHPAIYGMQRTTRNMHHATRHRHRASRAISKECTIGYSMRAHGGRDRLGLLSETMSTLATARLICSVHRDAWACCMQHGRYRTHPTSRKAPHAAWTMSKLHRRPSLARLLCHALLALVAWSIPSAWSSRWHDKLCGMALTPNRLRIMPQCP